MNAIVLFWNTHPVLIHYIAVAAFAILGIALPKDSKWGQVIRRIFPDVMGKGGTDGP